MDDRMYDESHVQISRLIGRQYNNPLGADAFQLLKRLVGDSPEPVNLLDVGCGRGRTALWWARRGARVVAFDPSSAMLAEAQRLLENFGLAEAVTFSCTDLENFRSEQLFDLVVVHDVLCYSDDRARDLGRILDHCRPQARVSLTDYFGDIAAPSVAEIVEAWGIRAPLPFEDYGRLLGNLGGDVLLLCETTRRYRDHWTEIRKRIEFRRSLILDQIDSSAVERFEQQIDSIEKAVEDRHFGHLWAILEKGKTEPANADEPAV